MGDDPAPRPQGRKAPARLWSRHAGEVSDGHKQGAVIGVAGAQERVDLEHRSTRVGSIYGVAVVDDALEHRQRSDPHALATVAPRF